LTPFCPSPFKSFAVDAVQSVLPFTPFFRSSRFAVLSFRRSSRSAVFAVHAVLPFKPFAVT